jgi:predicted hydrocarbon binding protein
MLLKRKKDICSKIFVLLQRNEVLNQFSPDKETVDKVLEYGLEESYQEVVDQIIPQVEQVFAEGDEMPPISEHHVSEEIGEDVFEETSPNVEYYAVEDSEGNVFDETTQSIGRQITEDFEEEVDKETVDKVLEYGLEESYQEVMDQIIPQVEQIFTEGDEMPPISEHHVSEEIGEDVFEETSPNVEYYAVEDSEGDVFDETTQSIGRQITEDFGEEVVDEVMDRKRDGESISNELVRSDNMLVEQK